MNVKIRRIAHRLFFAVLALITLLIFFYAEENWRGARAWEAARRDLRARGESLDPKDFIPPPVPDDQNLAMAPLFVQALHYQIDPATRLLTFGPVAEAEKGTLAALLSEAPYGRPKPGDPGLRSYLLPWLSAHRIDLAWWQQHYREHEEFSHPPQPQSPAEDVLLALTRYAPLLDELAQQAAKRPQTRFPLNWTQRPYWNIRLPHYNLINKLSATLRLRTSAELAVGQTAAALRDIELMHRLRDATANDPILIAVLVNRTDINGLLQPIWEGLAARQWSAADLDRLRGSLRGIDLLRGFQQAMRGSERAMLLGRLADDLQDGKQARVLAGFAQQKRWMGFSNLLESWLWQLLPYLPRGWYAQNAALACRLQQEYCIDAVDPASHRMKFLPKDKSLNQALEKLPVGPGTFIAKDSSPVFYAALATFAQTQAAVDQAMVACALEKYYLDHHAYPAALEGLVPACLDRVPNDVIDGAPMRYRLTIDGRYQLYSVGWDGKDEGGIIEWPADRKWGRPANGVANEQAPDFPNPARDRGDWVWQYAPAEPPAPPANQSRLESLP